MDWGIVEVFLEVEVLWVNCFIYGLMVVVVLWVCYYVGYMYVFDDMVVWLVVVCLKIVVCELMWIVWCIVGVIVVWVWVEIEKCIDWFVNLCCIGIDEIFYKCYYWYLMVVVDYDSGWLVWVVLGYDKVILGLFFDVLGVEWVV